MERHAEFPVLDVTEEQKMPETKTVPAQIIDLGVGNAGTFGPTAETNTDVLYADAANEAYHKPKSNRWVCVDGRGASNEEINRGVDVDPQIPGSTPITNTAADFMNAQLESPLLSEQIAINTQQDVEAGNEIVVHGDDHANEEGCAANKKMRGTLAYAAANADTIAPTVWHLSTVYGLDKLGVTPEDVTESLVTGGEHAQDDAAWDVTPQQVVKLILSNGKTADGLQKTSYATLTGQHTERLAGIELDDETAFDNRSFARNHVGPEGEEEAFGVALGAYVHKTIAERIQRGDSPADAAKHTMRGMAYVVALTKNITNEAMRVELFGEPKPVAVPR